VVATFTAQLCCHNGEGVSKRSSYACISNMKGKLDPFVYWRFFKLERVPVQVCVQRITCSTVSSLILMAC
jgi:hypothetical protein